jgi:hypothetical protein
LHHATQGDKSAEHDLVNGLPHLAFAELVNPALEFIAGPEIELNPGFAA